MGLGHRKGLRDRKGKKTVMMVVGRGTGKMVAWTGMMGMKWKLEQPWKEECDK